MTPKIIDYLIVGNASRNELITLIKENIDLWGWQPIGGICISRNDQFLEKVMFYQAMVKYAEV